MECNCKSKLVLKPEHATVKSSPSVNRPVNLAKVSEGDYALYATVWPSAFELVKQCTCKKIDKMDEAKKDTESFIKPSKKK
jgi:hypothetical protein